MKFFVFIFSFFAFFIATAQVDFSSSNLPILVINTTDGRSIPDEPKIAATMQIIYHGEGQTNHIDDKNYDYNGWIGIELRGQTSKSLFPKKPYGIETRDETGENQNVALLGMPAENDWVLHNPYSDKSLIRNALTYTLAGKIMDYAPRVRLVEVIINEVYQGVYVLTEKVKRDKNRVNVSKLTPKSEDISGGYILKFDKSRPDEGGFASLYPPIQGQGQKTNFLWHYPKFDEITPEQETYMQNFIVELEDVLKSVKFADTYRNYIDVSTFIDYLFINELSRNVDGYRLSTYMYKDRDSKDGRLKMGPVWDFNLAFGNANYCEGGNPIGWGYDFNIFCPRDNWVIHFWWRQFLKDPAFLKEVKEKWQAYRKKELSDDVIFGTIDSLSSLVDQGAVDRNFTRWDAALGQYVWPNNFVGPTYQSEVAYLKNWTTQRLAWLDKEFDNFESKIPPPITVVRDAIKVYPNPSKNLVSFEYQLNSGIETSIRIYNSIGQIVQELVEDQAESAKDYQFTWENPPATGVYYYNVVSKAGVEFTGKVVILD